MNDFFIKNYEELKLSEYLRAAGASLTASSATLFATQAARVPVSAGLAALGLFLTFGELKSDKSKEYLYPKKEELEYLETVKKRSSLLSKLFGGLTVISIPLQYAAWFYNFNPMVPLAGLAISTFGLARSMLSIKNINDVASKMADIKEYNKKVELEKKAVKRLEIKCAKHPKLIEAIQEIYSCTHDYPLNEKNRTISDVYASSQRMLPDTLFTFEWAHRKLDKIVKAKGQEKIRLIKKIERLSTKKESVPARAKRRIRVI